MKSPLASTNQAYTMREMNQQPVVFIDCTEAESKTVTEESALDVIVARLLLGA